MTAFRIRNDADHARAMELIDQLWDAAPGTPEGETLQLMAELVEAYEAKDLARVLPPPDPRELIRFKLRELDISQRELGRRLSWSKGRVSEVLSGTRSLSLNMILDLERVLGLPPGLLVQDRSETSDEGTWVRLPAKLVVDAQKAAFAGCSGLEELVERAVRAALTFHTLTRSQASGGTLSRTRAMAGPSKREASRDARSVTRERMAA